MAERISFVWGKGTGTSFPGGLSAFDMLQDSFGLRCRLSEPRERGLGVRVSEE